jgi:uncharacterized repeat protein (TIGR02543 family)
MKTLRCLVVFLLVLSVTFTFAKKKDNDATLISQTRDQTVLRFDITSYDFENVGTASKLVAPNTAEIMVKGAPAVRKLSAAVIVPDDREMQVKVLNSKYVDIENVDLVPSKGNLLRTVNPDDIPYEYGRQYQTDAFYPGDLVELTDPYITRDYRGQAVIATPFQYNPVTKVLRVYTELKVKVSPTGNRGKNTLNRKNRKIPREFKNVYTRHYINYKEVSGSLAAVQYTPLPDPIGTMLIVCYSSFMDEMADFVTWKQSIGYTVDLVDYSTIGSSSALKTYVSNYYNSNGLTYLLLVGDHAQVPASSTSAGASDNNYGYIVGGDHYLDIFVGRFSAETAAHVTTQVDRTIYYERDLASSANWFRHAIGMASSEGPGHNGEYDAVHMDQVLSDLSGYGYTTHKNYQSGGSASNLSNLVNNGAGTMWYCGHGSNTAWTCGWTFSTSNVNALTNEWELPAIYSVACVIGNFTGMTCFCESWLRATNNGNPTGAVVHAGSTINQSWNPPMDAQDEFADLLVSGSGPKRTFGGVFANGMFKMIDINGSGGESMADTWTCFGDSSVQLRTPGTPDGPEPTTPDPPVADFTADTTTVTAGGSVNFTDLSTNSPTSWDWTFEGGTPSSSTAENPTVTYNTAGTFDVVLSVSNSAGSDTETKTNYITVTAPQPPVANFTASSTSISVGDSVTFTDTSTNTPTSWSWTFAGGTPGSSTAQNPTITYNTVGTFDVSLTAANAAGSDNETKVGYIDVSAVPYCTSSGGSQSYEYIAGVAVADLNNSSGPSPYTDFTGYTAHLTQGDSASVSLTPGFVSSSYTEYWKIWVDYNGDHDFEDSGEEVFSGSGSSTVTGSFTVPGTAPLGDTRMRVSMSYSTYPPICGTFDYGEVEDYTANIAGACTQFTLTTNVVGNGSISLNPPGGTYCEGTEVTLTAVPDAGWQFDGWSGDLSGTQNPTTITMGSNKNVTATFSQLPVQQYSLTVNTVGQGSVTLNPPGGVYDEGTVVTLTAVPDSGWKFDNWSGDLTGSTNPDTITMNANKTVTANFSEVGNCTEIVGHDTVFGTSTTTANRRAMPFTMPENGDICSVTMYHTGGSGSMILGVYDGEGLPANRLGVTATTAVSGSTGWQTIDLTSTAFVAGGSTVWLAWVYESNPGIYYQTGSPGRAHSTDTWSGGMPDPFGSSTQADYLYSIYANYTPAAPPQYTLTTNTVGNGSIALNPAGGTYDAGTVVTLTATPDSGWQFDGWSGDLSGSTNPTTITMNSNKSVTATFSEVGTTGTVGNETVFGSTSTSGNRRAMPFTMPENGTITSVTMYHTGGSGSMILGVYDGEGTPQNRLGVTPTTAISGSTGWQTINLTGSAFVSGGATVWLAWVYESNPGIRYQTGSPGRYQSTATWSGAMPDPFGSGSQADYL